MNPNTGEIYELEPGQSPRPGDVAITEAEKREMVLHPGPERMAALERFRSEPPRTPMKPATPRTKSDRTSGMPRRTNGDRPGRGQKKGRRG